MEGQWKGSRGTGWLRDGTEYLGGKGVAILSARARRTWANAHARRTRLESMATFAQPSWLVTLADPRSSKARLTTSLT